jgi:hypothetical protein
MLGFSFLLFIKSIRHDIRSVGRVQHKINSCIGVGVFPWIIDEPSDSAPHVPMYHYAAFALSFSHITPLNFGPYAFRSCLDFVVFSRQKQKFEKHTKINPFATFVISKIISFRIAKSVLISNLSNVLPRSLIPYSNWILITCQMPVRSPPSP